jgi:hypothetical protein
MNYFDWKKAESSCDCGWSGPNSSISMFETFGELFEYYCPGCNEELGLVMYPTFDEIREAAAAGDEEAISMSRELP